MSTTLYRYFDTDDVLLYVGITSNRQNRADQHSKSAVWWRFVARCEMEHFRTRQQAERAERRAIQLEHPVYNKQHAGPPLHIQTALDRARRWRRRHPERGVAHANELAGMTALPYLEVISRLRSRGLPHRKFLHITMVPVSKLNDIICDLTEDIAA